MLFRSDTIYVIRKSGVTIVKTEAIDKDAGMSGSHFLINVPNSDQEAALIRLNSIPRLISSLPIFFPPAIVRMTPVTAVISPIINVLFRRVCFSSGKNRKAKQTEKRIPD